MSQSRNRSQNPTVGMRSVDWVVSPSGDIAIASGETIELRVTIVNHGHQGAVFDLYLDDTAEQVRRWCRDAFQRLALNAQQSAEAVFRFEIPIQTLPDDYPYLLILDAPDHYPEETPLQHPGHFRVLPPIQTIERAKDPTFTLLPETTPERPIPVHPRQPIELQALVRNRSERVDRFRLTCTDLPESWYRIIYPEGLQDLGQVIAQDSLLLNPGAEGRILLLLDLPTDIRAGRYLPTLRLHANNHPNLVLIDIAYLQVDPSFALDLTLREVMNRVQSRAGQFQLTLANGSNTSRTLTLTAQETAENPLCRYELATESLVLAPSAMQKIELAVQPIRRWRRPWWGKGLTIPFFVEAHDTFELPVDRDRVTGELIWEPRPLWQRLLAILLILSGLTVLGLLLWWLFFRPSVRLQVSEFNSEGEAYEFAQGDFIHLRWQIGPPEAIRSVQLTGQAVTGSHHPTLVTYDFSQGIPTELEDLCTSDRHWLTCRFVRTDARLPGDYQFNLTVVPKKEGQAIATSQTAAITIAPLPTPEITRFTSRLLTWKPPVSSAANDSAANSTTRTTATSSRANIAKAVNLLRNFPWLIGNARLQPDFSLLSDRLLALDWQIAHPQQLVSLELTGRLASGDRDLPILTWSFEDGILPEELQPFCRLTGTQLICQQFPAALLPGDYVYELTAIYGTTRTDPVGTTITAETDPLKLVPPPMPEVTDFGTDRFTYAADAEEPIRLQWTIAHPEQLQAVEIVGRSPTDQVSVPPLKYTFSGGIPPILEDYCQITPEELTCSDVPLEFQEPGQHQFELTLIPKGTIARSLEPVQSELIDIDAPTTESPEPEVVFFHINGENAPPKYTVELAPDTPTQSIRLSWKATGTDVQVELLPTPGTVPSDAFLTYSLGPGEKTETLTLRVTDSEGQQVQRSVVIATTVTPPPAVENAAESAENDTESAPSNANSRGQLNLPSREFLYPDKSR